ncbi:hypothetical protein EVAR_85487_1 [Eumeta japonica]|uniref:Uncharacterized protein n=1 Tax=Eumeta variegata TaxID=151549 RepID=A0A4C1VCI6_EUMVA|nr:hypothetical protein EVAR_85487_1 [Eumeta japonica]
MPDTAYVKDVFGCGTTLHLRAPHRVPLDDTARGRRTAKSRNILDRWFAGACTERRALGFRSLLVIGALTCEVRSDVYRKCDRGKVFFWFRSAFPFHSKSRTFTCSSVKSTRFGPDDIRFDADHEQKNRWIFNSSQVKSLANERTLSQNVVVAPVTAAVRTLDQHATAMRVSARAKEGVVGGRL